MKAPRSLFGRLTAYFAGIVFLTLAAMIGLTLLFADRSFSSSQDSDLLAAAHTVELRLQTEDAHQAVNELATAAQFLEIADPSGEITVRSTNLGHESLPTYVRVGTPRTNDGYHTVKFRRAEVRMIRHPLITNGEVTGYIIIGNIQRVDSRLLTLTAILCLTALAALIGATLGTVWLVRRESRPLRELAQETLATSDSGFERSIPARGGGSEEVQDLRAALSALVASQRQLLDRERAFFADSSHVLRTPLTVLQGDLEMLEQGVYGREREEAVAQARNAIETMSRTISGLLLLAREPGVADTLSWEVVELDALLGSLAADARTAFPGLTIASEGDSPLELAGDPVQLRSLFLSLIENACRYTPTGGTVTIDARTSDADIVVEVRDTGIGLSETDTAHAFERFYRGDRARQLVPTGSGLGLAIASRLAEVHGGSLVLEPREDGGTIVRVTLPRLG